MSASPGRSVRCSTRPAHSMSATIDLSMRTNTSPKVGFCSLISTPSGVFTVSMRPVSPSAKVYSAVDCTAAMPPCAAFRTRSTARVLKSSPPGMWPSVDSSSRTVFAAASTCCNLATMSARTGSWAASGALPAGSCVRPAAAQRQRQNRPIEKTLAVRFMLLRAAAGDPDWSRSPRARRTLPELAAGQHRSSETDHTDRPQQAHSSARNKPRATRHGRPSMNPTKLVLLLAPALLLATAPRADEVRLRDGRVLYGKVTEEKATNTVLIETRDGAVRVAAEEVVGKPRKDAELRDDLRKLAGSVGDTPFAHLQLAMRAREFGLDAE